MYEDFFKLQTSPFGMSPDPKCIFMTRSHREAFAGLLYAVSRRKGFVVLTGEAGTGKTSLLRALMRSAGDAKFSLIFTPRVSTDEFLEMVLLDFGVTDVPPAKSQRIVKLQQILVELRRQGKASVLVVDEAHALSPETLEEIRLLTNFEADNEKLLQVILAGQSDLALILNRQDLRQLKQRVEIRLDLKPLEPGNLGSYMQHRWSYAGGTTALPFSRETIALIGKASRGIPRLVNAICDNALLLAYACEAATIVPEHIFHVLRDLDIGESESTRGSSVPPLVRRDVNQPISAENALADMSTVSKEIDAASPKPSLALRLVDELSFASVRWRAKSS